MVDVSRTGKPGINGSAGNPDGGPGGNAVVWLDPFTRAPSNGVEATGGAGGAGIMGTPGGGGAGGKAIAGIVMSGSFHEPTSATATATGGEGGGPLGGAALARAATPLRAPSTPQRPPRQGRQHGLCHGHWRRKLRPGRVG